MRSIITSFVLVLCFLAINILSAQKISIQGTLKDINGKAVPDNTALSVTFKIYANATGGTALWTETANVPVSGGVYSHYLGNVTALDPGIFTGVRFLGVTVNGSELSPRTELSYSPYALSVATAQGIANNTGTALFTNSGDLILNKSLLLENNQSINGKNVAGTAQTCLVPRGTDDVTKLRYGNGGLILESNNGFHAMFLKSSPRNVGIGTMDPKSRLDVWGNLTIGEAYAGVNTAPANGVIIQGNVGIGTSTPDPDKSLVINNNSTTNWLPIIEFDKGISDSNFKLVVRKGQSGSASGTIISQFGMMFDDGSTTHDNAMIRFHRGGSSTGGYFSFTADNNIEVVRIGNDFSGSGETRWFSKSNDIAYTTVGSWNNVSLATEGSIWVNNGGYYATSDERIKREITLTNNKKDLETLNKIQISNYLFKDVNTNGNKSQKKVIAQQVNSVYPIAITKNKGYIPNVYELASELSSNDNITKISTIKNHDFKTGDIVKLIVKDNGVKQVFVKDILDNNTFIIDEKLEGEVFVYGKEVDDLLNVDYDALSMLNISATQELYNRIVALEVENTKLKTENKSLIDNQTSLETRLTKVEGFMKSIKTSTSSLD